MQLRCTVLRGATPHSHAACPTARVHRVQPVQRPKGSTTQCRSSSFELDTSVTSDEAAKFEKIAASLVAKYGAEDGEDAAELGDMADDDSIFVDFGSSEDKEDLDVLQADLEARRASQASTSSTSSSSTDAPLYNLSQTTRRSKRKAQIPTEFLPKVAIIGRPNVGKSALFNRLAGSSVAVVYDEPGVTRDRLYHRAFFGDKEYVLIDTGGLMSDAAKLPLEQQQAAIRSISADGLPSAIERQAAAGVDEADVILMVTDGQVGLQPGDQEIIEWIRTKHPGKPITMAVNKCESVQKGAIQAAEFWETGIEPFPVSAISGTGTGDMLEALLASLPAPKSLQAVEEQEGPLAVAIIGRPNVGKSSLLNAICGEERSIVCDMSGTTRDAVDTQVTLPSGQVLKLVDTAGIRKRAKVADSRDGPEQISVDRAIRAFRRADIGVLVIDGAEGITQQDFRLSELMAGEGLAVVVVVNKWDKVDQEKWTEQTYKEEVKSQLRQVNWAGVVCTTAVKGRNVDKVVEAILKAGEQHRRRVSTATLNMVLREAVNWKAPPTQRTSRRKGRVYYATQAGAKPPTFVFFVNDPKLFSDDYRRYMERQLRDNIGFEGTPLRLLWRGKPPSDIKRREQAQQAQQQGSSSGRN